MTTHRYYFAPDPLALVRSGINTATVRYDDERDPSPDDRMKVIDAETDRRVGYATITNVGEAPVRRILDVIEAFDADYYHRYPGSVAARLGQYYDATITMETEVRAIAFDPDVELLYSDHSINNPTAHLNTE